MGKGFYLSAKKCLGILIALVLMLSTVITPMAASPVGDLNGDDTVSAPDLVTLKTVIMTGDRDMAYDVNGDGVINVLDLVRLKKMLALAKTEVTVPVEAVDGKVPEGGVTLTGGGVSAFVPAGVLLEDGVNELKLTVIPLTSSGIPAEEGETVTSYDVHISGISKENTIPVIIDLGAVMPKFLNMGNYKIYHVEDGENVLMTLVSSREELTAHNQFTYEPETGKVTVAMATFSEVALVSAKAVWEGKFDYSWYKADATDLTIANADQLAALSAIVGGMNGQTQDSFKGKTIKLLSNINLGDAEKSNDANKIFYPIGYYSSDDTYEKTGESITSGFYTFEGTFDGNGHTISNIYQNTWEMKGDNNYYDATLQYYRDGMGLFGKVYGGTVKNLTVDNFTSDGEYTTTGVIAAYADGATFENIAITNCNPRVYNIGNGGIVGCVGWYAKDADLKTTFTNITVDNSNKISALWGSWDVACGGIVGQYYPTSGQTSAGTPKNAGIHFDNCHVSAQMDVYNDVCANYQYYAYRYTGMMIGSIRENETIDGHVYPKMDGITANGCTVNFGDWNDYYYCELVANSLASYTHDHQFSRLQQVDSVDVVNKTVTVGDKTTEISTSGSYNYVVVNENGHATENATCYHFVNGEQWTHDKAGTETVDGATVLKEDKQHIYLEFNNLFTGYGWGVTSKGVNDYEGVETMGITTGNQEESVEKFTAAAVAELPNNTAIKISDIFTENNANTSIVEIKNDSIIVAVNDLDDTDGIVTAEFVRGETWDQGTITFTGKGKVEITIQDYYFCTPTIINVTVNERVAVEKFETKFTGDFLYRVGNADKSTVKLDNLFKESGKGTVGTVVVDFETISGNALGTYTSNATWTQGTIQFSGTGVVKVTITDNDYCTPTELYLEVVDAVNATTSTSATANNVVLLNDCGFSSLEVSGGYALYGNGFTMTCGSDSVALDFGYSFVTLNNGTLDNVQIVCPNFDYAALYKSNLTSSDNRSSTDSTGKTRYYNAKSGVMASGNSQILNSRISGARAAVNVSGGNVVIDNSRIELGAVASILVGAANSLTLRDITLVQEPTASTYKDEDGNSKTLMGFSVLVMCDSEGKGAPITLEGEFVQNAWVDENDKSYVPSAGQSVVENVMSKTEYLHDIDENGTDESLNLGFAYMPETNNNSVNEPKNLTDNRENNDIAPYKFVKISGAAYVYSYTNTNGTDSSFVNLEGYTPNKYSDIVTVSYSDTTDGLKTGKNYGANGWVYELNVDLDKLSGYALDFSKLSMVVNGVSVTDYKVDGNDKPTSTIPVVAGGTTYTLTATVNGKEYTATYKVTGTETSKESPSLVASNYEDALLVGEAGSTFSKDTWHGAAPALEGIQIKYWSVAEKQYKTITLSDYTPTTAGKQNGTNTTWTYSPDNGDFTLTLTGGQVHSSNNVNAMPVVVDNKLYFVAAGSNGLVNYGNSARTIPVTYSFKDNNGGTELTFSHTWSIECANGNTCYDYSEFCNGTRKTFNIKSSNGSGCVTPDTLVTLADGTKKKIQNVTVGEEVIAWNFYTGDYEIVPVTLLQAHSTGDLNVLKLYFEDDTELKVIGEHGIFDADLNTFIFIDEDDVENYLGHNFVKQDGDSIKTVKLVDYEVVNEYTTSYTILSKDHYNVILEDMFTVTPAHVGGNFFNPFDIGEDMKYNEEAVRADIEKYGLYTYEDFAHVLTPEQFEVLNLAHFKVSVGKGLVTYDGLIYLIETFINGDY